MLENVYIEVTLESLTKQYPMGEQLKRAFSEIANQAMAANMLAEQNKLLKVENDRLKTKNLADGRFVVMCHKVLSYEEWFELYGFLVEDNPKLRYAMYLLVMQEVKECEKLDKQAADRGMTIEDVI